MTGFWSTAFTHTTTTRLPDGVSEADVLRVLHDHVAMIRLNPLVVDCEREDVEKDGGAAAQYAITDRIALLPCGLWQGRVRYGARFENTPHGLKTSVDAPGGLTSEATWVVEEREEPKELWMVETAQVTCSRLVHTFVEGTMRASHEDLCRRLVEKLREPSVEPTAE